MCIRDSLPTGRQKPWGTAHAVLAAGDLVHGPFAVINADDFYGAHAFKMLSEQLSAPSDDYAIYIVKGCSLRDYFVSCDP